MVHKKKQLFWCQKPHCMFLPTGQALWLPPRPPPPCPCVPLTLAVIPSFSSMFTSSGPHTTLSGRMIPGALEKSLGIYVALGWASTVTGDMSVWRPRWLVGGSRLPPGPPKDETKRPTWDLAWSALAACRLPFPCPDTWPLTGVSREHFLNKSVTCKSSSQDLSLGILT